MELINKLQQRAAINNPVSVGIIGCGQMGSGLAHTINNIKGMQVNAIADINPELALKTYNEMGIPRSQIIVTENTGIANDSLNNGKFIVTPEHNRIAMDLVASGKVNADKFISHVFPLSQFAEGAELALEGKARKVVFIP